MRHHQPAMLTHLRRLALLALLALLIPPASPASACGNEVERVVDLTNQAIRAADDLLARGHWRSAAKVVANTFPRVLQAEHSTRRQELFHRGQQIVALAIVRSGGDLRLPGLPGKTEADRDLAIAWAAGILRLHVARGHDRNVVLRSELAEALALRPAERHEARDILKQLAETDIIPTARAWLVLANLETQRGDSEAAARAILRCREISADDRDCVTNTVS